MPRDYYEILGVERGASEQEIKRAYRQAAIRWHPDRNPEAPEAAERFKEAAEAYAVLGDRQKRARYDRFGAAGVSAGGAGFDPAIFTEFQDIFGGFSIFEDLFGAAFGGRRRRGGPRRGADLRYDLELEFLEAARGIETRVVIPRLGACATCDGSGAASGRVQTCSTCGGQGQVRFQQGVFTVSRTCGACRGRGRQIVDPCADCEGGGRVRQEAEIHVRVPPGVENGTRLRISGQGEAGTEGGPHGDLYVVLRVREHEYFERDGLDLHCRLPVTFTQAALGASMRAPGLDEDQEVDVPAGTQSGSVIRLRGRGIQSPNGGGRGDQLLHVQVLVPRRLSSRQRELLRELAETEPKAPEPGDKNFFQRVRELFS